MKYDDTYSMIGAIINQGFETQFEKERKKKEKRRKYFRKLLAFLAHQGKRFNWREHKKNQHSSGFVERKSHKMQKCGLQIFSVIL